MTTEVSEKLYTVEEFLNLEWPEDEAENDDTVYELIGGRIVAKDKPGGPSGKHGEIITNIATALKVFANSGETSLGRVFSTSATTLGRPKGSNYLVPDVSFVAAGQIPAEFDGPIPVAPDLVVKVNSPSDSIERIQDKLQAYREAGVRKVWSVYFWLDKYVLVHTLNDPDIRLLNLKDELDCEDILPGFRLKVSEIFK